MKFKPMDWIAVYRFAATFVPILCNTLMGVILLVPGCLSMSIWSSTSVPGSIKITGSSKSWTKSKRENTQ